MDSVQLPQRCRATMRWFNFSHYVPRSSWYSLIIEIPTVFEPTSLGVVNQPPTDIKMV